MPMRLGAWFIYAMNQNFLVDGRCRFMADVREAPMRLGTEDPWALTKLAKAGGLGGVASQPRRGWLGR